MSNEKDEIDIAIDDISTFIAAKSKSGIKDIIQKILSEACNGQSDGSHHKAQTIDTIVRIATDCPTITKTAKDCNGLPYEYESLGKSSFYDMFVKAYEAWDEDGDKEYSWEIGF